MHHRQVPNQEHARLGRYRYRGDALGTFALDVTLDSRYRHEGKAISAGV